MKTKGKFTHIPSKHSIHNQDTIWDDEGRICIIEEGREDLIPLFAASKDLLEDAITDIGCIEDFIKRFKNGETKEVVYFLENLLVSKRAVICKAKGIKMFTPPHYNIKQD